MKVRGHTRILHTPIVLPKKNSTSTLLQEKEVRPISLRQTLCGTAWKVTKASLLILGTAFLIYCNFCEMDEHNLCILRNDTDISESLELVEHLIEFMPDII